MEVKRYLAIFPEDCAVQGVIYDPSRDIGLQLIAVISRLLPLELRPVLQLPSLLLYTLLSFG